jgi:hypothetical protein
VALEAQRGEDTAAALGGEADAAQPGSARCGCCGAWRTRRGARSGKRGRPRFGPAAHRGIGARCRGPGS